METVELGVYQAVAFSNTAWISRIEAPADPLCTIDFCGRPKGLSGLNLDFFQGFQQKKLAIGNYSHLSR